jgi:hypothetical protein
MIGGNRRQALGNQKVVGIAGTHLDHVTLAAKRLNAVDQQQLNAAMGTAGELVGVGTAELLLGFHSTDSQNRIGVFGIMAI